MRFSERVSGIGTETAFEAAGRARASRRGPGHHPPGDRRAGLRHAANVRDAAKRALDAGLTHYGPPLGLRALREAIAADATARKGFTVDGQRGRDPGAKPS